MELNQRLSVCCTQDKVTNDPQSPIYNQLITKHLITQTDMHIKMFKAKGAC